MGTANIAAVIGGVAAVIAAFLTYRSSSQANRISAAKVDSEAYDRAQAIWERALTHSEREIETLRKHVERLEAQLQNERELRAALRAELEAMKETLARMERQNRLLRELLRQAGISIPDGMDGTAQAV